MQNLWKRTEIHERRSLQSGHFIDVKNDDSVIEAIPWIRSFIDIKTMKA